MSGFSHRTLGRTGLRVSPLGIGGGIQSRDLLYAFERGINYFFYSSDLHHHFYRSSAQALRQLCGTGSRVREQVVLATVSYVNDPEKLPAVLMDQFGELGVDYVDVFHWGWVTERHDCEMLFEAASELKRDGAASQAARRRLDMLERAAQVNENLARRGLVRFVGASFHDRALARQWMEHLDVLMIRYNLSHPGAELDVFPVLSGDEKSDPGVVVFNAAHDGMGFFYRPPEGYPEGMYVPWPPDCYRWALSHPAVDLVLAGLSSRKEIDQALAAMEQGPMNEAERTALRKYGDLHAGRARVKARNCGLRNTESHRRDAEDAEGTQKRRGAADRRG
jgi:predicted aldo/keto reductase-like oxidoreductase